MVRGLRHRPIHELKIEPQYLDRLMSEVKRFEIRFNDRDYQVGDYIRFVGNSRHPLGENFKPLFEITYLCHFPQGLKENWVVLGVEIVKEQLNKKTIK